MSRVKTILNSVILAGALVLLIGLYYSVIKAGIPYQDPTADMMIKYEAFSKTGEELMSLGSVMLIFGCAARMIAALIGRKSK